MGHGYHRNKGQKDSGKGRNSGHEISSFLLETRILSP
jgi:hypothetical protein